MANIGLEGARLLAQMPPFRGIVEEINQKTAEQGISEAARFLLDRAHVNITAQWDNKSATEEVLRTQPVIIVGNHPHEIEPLFVAYVLPSRQDLYLIAAEGAGEIFGGAVNEHLFSVRRGKRTENESERARRRQFNADSISRASELLQEGHAIAVFPDGGDYSKIWRPGVAKLADSMHDAFLVMTDVQGTESGDIRRLISGLLRRGTSLSRTIRISTPARISDLVPPEVFDLPEAQRIPMLTALMQQHYTDWQTGKTSTAILAAAS